MTPELRREFELVDVSSSIRRLLTDIETSVLLTGLIEVQDFLEMENGISIYYYIDNSPREVGFTIFGDAHRLYFCARISHGVYKAGIVTDHSAVSSLVMWAMGKVDDLPSHGLVLGD